ncbi:PPE family protein [Mycobacterium colombiense]|uniref:PPE family protein n=1 Tax=Mycobacterium colombiense TaxID=339268 RepID=UPI00200A1A83|nr:PPE family protein [Mycobacterium colombiense]MCK8645181.1 PPE family protein [Mycobacterium colombiense]
MDFGALPPEVNSGRIYSGPGAGSLRAAALAWDTLAGDLYLAATAYGSAISTIAYQWVGRASTAMTEAATPYVAWLSTTAGQALQAANHAQSAADFYEAAFTAMVPPPLIAENRAILLLLVSTNVLGQNSTAIASTEAEYDQMWAQDAAAMYGYAASSAAATGLTPFLSPPATTDPAGVAEQGVAVSHAAGDSGGLRAQEVMSTGSQLITTVPQALRELATAPASASGISASASLSGAMSKLSTLVETPAKLAMHPLNFINSALSLSKGVAAPAATAMSVESTLGHAVSSGSRALGSGLSGLGGNSATMTTGVARALSIGSLSVPHAWAAAPASSPAAVELPSASWPSALVTDPLGSPPTGLPFIPMASTGGRGMSDAASRFEMRPTVVSRSPAGG